MRARTHTEEIRKDRTAIIVTEIPYQVNKSRMVERIAEVVRDKTVEDISDLRDESDRDGVRVVIELKRDASPEVVLAQLFRFTPLQTSFGVNMLALNNGRPEMLTLRDVIAAFVAFREEVLIRRTTYELGKTRERAHILAGLLVAISNIDPVIAMIRAANDPVTARENLMAQAWEAGEVAEFIQLIDDPAHQVVEGKYRLSETQARAILELRLQRLTGMERDKLAEETRLLATKIAEYLALLGSKQNRMALMREEFIDIRDRFSTPRRTLLEESEFEHDIEDLIQREDMVMTVTHGGYIKRVPLSSYRAQRRGGKGRSGMSTKEDDFVVKVFVTNTHTPVLFFSSHGLVYQLKVYRLPLGKPQARGKALVNLLPLKEGENITAIMPLPEDEENWADLFVMFATKSGKVRRNRLSDFTNIKSNGKIAMKLEADDQLVNVAPCTEEDDVILATQKSMAIRFAVPDIRVFVGRNSVGVRGIRLTNDDRVISMSIIRHNSESVEDRRMYLQTANAKRRLENQYEYNNREDEARDKDRIAAFDAGKFTEMALQEQFLLTVANDGMGQLVSTYDYRVMGRGGKGVANMTVRDAATEIVATFSVAPAEDELILVTDEGQIIRLPVAGVRYVKRNSLGVRLFRIEAEQKVVSATSLKDNGEDDTESEAAETTGETDTENTPHPSD